MRSVGVLVLAFLVWGAACATGAVLVYRATQACDAVEHQVAVDGQVQAVVRKDPELGDRLGAERAAQHELRPEAVVHTTTTRVAATGTPLPAQTCPPAAVAQQCAPCLLAPGNPIEGELDQVLLRRKDGRPYVVGGLTPFRVAPEPRTALGHVTFAGPADEETAPPGPEPPAVGRWGAGLTVFWAQQQGPRVA